MPESVRFVIATYALQATASLLMAGVLLGLWRSYRRSYLVHVAGSWCALSAMFIASTVGLWASAAGLAADHFARLAATFVAQLAAFLQALLLLGGSFEVARRTEIRPRLMAWAAAPLAVVAVILTLLFAGDPDAGPARLMTRVGIRSMVVGIAFVVGGVWLIRRRLREDPGLGLKLVAASFLLYGLQQLHVFALMVHQLTTGEIAAYAPVLSFVEFFLLVMIGLGTLVWMLETERRRSVQAAREIDVLSHYDRVTGLPNRAQLLDLLDGLVAGARHRSEKLAVVALDLDGFRALNDSLGRSVGDDLLRTMAQRLRAEPDPPAVLGRIGADEFALALTGVGRATELEERVAELSRRIRRPVWRQGHELYLTCCAGLAVFPDDAAETTRLLHAAESALHQAQQTDRDHLQRFRSGMSSLAADRLRFETSLRRALDVRQFELHYQPIESLHDGRLVALEALVRWQHPVRGLLGPDEFLGVAEDIGSLRHLERWVVATAVERLSDWRARGARGLTISVNLSPQRFQSAGLVDWLLELCSDHQVPPSALQLEITEGSAMPHTGPTLEVLRDLRGVGFRISVDDFGSGYSSLALIRNLPIDQLKIDRSFVRRIDDDARDAAVVQAVVTLAHGLGLPVVAEGVETEAQRTAALGMGCDLVQGFVVGRPVDAEATDRLLAERGLTGLGRDAGNA